MKSVSVLNLYLSSLDMFALMYASQHVLANEFIFACIVLRSTEGQYFSCAESF